MMKQKLKEIIQSAFSTFGYVIIQKNHVYPPPDTRCTIDGTLQSLSSKKTKIETIIDIGASDGRWSVNAMRYFPNAQYFLVEAQQCHKPALEKLGLDMANLRSVLAAAGDKVGTIYFDAGNPFGGLASHTPFPTNNIEVPVTTLDFEVSKNNLHGPFLIKFDTHGFEIPILKGAIQTLEQTSVIIMECYLHRLTEDSLLFHEICLYLDELGFRCIDMVDPVWRAYDDTFWQMDLIFIRKESPEFQYSQYE